MLELRDIKKHYELKDQQVNALKGINLCFRRSEFVSILGHSGCGKTTLLNIIGGLDRYTSGDLIIDGVSTKEFQDKHWDNYRNHRVGFVFQNYNLIPHQTVLENVELALTLSGIKKAERRKRAIEVLEKVGLKDKLKSKPNQLSGGQMQRVAIARALVNDPEIILADEPTGALDSKTSIQIMDILKQVSLDRLVIMVTHNPELAEKYSSRIVRLLDGELIEDTKPYTSKQCAKDIEKHKQQAQKTDFVKTEKKKSMSFFTALSLSLKNLLTKKGRTIMVSFAGSIGIIGIALILAVSAGMTNYINKMQSDSLASYPIAVSSVAVDMNAATSAISGGISAPSVSEEDSIAIYNPADMFTNMGSFNYLSKEFVNHIKNYYSQPENAQKINALSVRYASDMRLITTKTTQEPQTTTYVPINSPMSMSAMNGTISSTFYEGVNNKDCVLANYEVIGGTEAHYPQNANEVALVINSASISITDLASVGIEFEMSEEDASGKTSPLPVKYSSIIGKTYKLIKNNAYYNSITEKPKVNFSLLSGGEAGINAFYSQYTQEDLQGLYNHEETETLTISCILKLKDNATGSMFANGIMYLPELAESYHNSCVNSIISNTVKAKYLQYTTNENGQPIKAFINNGEDPFVNNFNLKFKEMAMLTDKDLFVYSSPKVMQETLKTAMNVNLTDEQIIDFYLQIYGASSIPTGIYCYPVNFDAKNDFINVLKTWNNSNPHNKILHTDSTAMLTNMLENLVNTISYVLIAFAGISLLVSSVMISIITYTSVIERTKEIGVLRSVGASKRDISSVFNAETVIIGLVAGLLGVGVSALFTIPISLLLKSLTGIAGLATLDLLPAAILVVISVVLTFIAGLVPAIIASKKDPVIALRTE